MTDFRSVRRHSCELWLSAILVLFFTSCSTQQPHVGGESPPAYSSSGSVYGAEGFDRLVESVEFVLSEHALPVLEIKNTPAATTMISQTPSGARIEIRAERLSALLSKVLVTVHHDGGGTLAPALATEIRGRARGSG